MKCAKVMRSCTNCRIFNSFWSHAVSVGLCKNCGIVQPLRFCIITDLCINKGTAITRDCAMIIGLCINCGTVKQLCGYAITLAILNIEEHTLKTVISSSTTSSRSCQLSLGMVTTFSTVPISVHTYIYIYTHTVNSVAILMESQAWWC